MKRATAMRLRHAAIAILVAGVASAPRARADDGAIVVGGSADEHTRGVVSAAVAAAARQAGWSLPPDAVAPRDADPLLDCGDAIRPWSCVPASIAGRGVRRIFVFTADRKPAESGLPMVVLSAKLIATSPQALVVRQRFCEHCADDRLTAASAELARQLLRDLAVRSGRTILEVASTPPGARISLDGQPIGATDATFNTFPGAHVVVVEKAGYRSEARTVVAEEGKTATVAVAMTPSPSPSGRSRWVTGALLGGGAAALIGGAVLLDRGASGDRDDKYRYPGATPAGALIGIAGAAAITAGVVRWWRASRSPAPSVAITSGGGIVAGWSAAF